MESSWSYDSGDKTGFINWGFKGSSYTSYDHNTMFISSPLDNQEVGFTDMIKKQSSHDSLRNCLSSNGSGGGDEESSSYCRDSSLIDLKLGRFGDTLTYNAANIRVGAPVVSCADSSTAPSKRVKSSILNSQIAVCQVYGCNKDLTSSKDYHKRHKVCDVHSKTAKVIVNGVEQRFCQQCSRFHLLGEFDDGKRSCRRRLAGHNERRRKPQVGLHPGRAGRLIHSYNGFGEARRNGTTMTATSFICQDILPSANPPLHSEKSHIKLENGADFGSKLESCWIDGQFLQKPVCPPYELTGVNTSAMTASVFNENSFNQYHPQDTVSCSLFQSNLFDTASTVEGFHELSSKSGCALSLLSSQSSHHSSGMQTSNANAQHPLMMPGNGSHGNNYSVSEDVFGVGSMDLSNGVSYNNGSGFSGGFLHGSEYVNVKSGPSFDDGATIDLLQLSTQLQRVENQRQAVSVKQEDDTFCFLKIT